jgi:hypothetical protein
MAIKNQSVKQPQSEGSVAPKKLQLLFTVVNRKKAEFYADFLQSFEVNMQLTLAASGTASSETLSLLGLTDSEKSVIISVIKEENGLVPVPSEPDTLKPEERYPELAEDCESVFVNMVTVDVDEYAKNNFL